HALPELWERRRDDPDFLRLSLGRGNLPSEIEIRKPPGGDHHLFGEVLAAMRPLSLRGAPLTVDVAAARVVAVTGQPGDSGGLVRWLVIQAACLHSPGELGIAALLADKEGWDWLGWLPHTAPGGMESARRLIASGPRARRL